jgi:hypothetical protein
VLKASLQLMKYIEHHFSKKVSLFRLEALEKVKAYHSIVKDHIDSTGCWKMAKKGKEKVQNLNKAIRSHESPNRDSEVLEKYQAYICSEERAANLRKILHYAEDGAPLPSDGVMTELGQILMGELITTTGVRPVVVRQLPLAAYFDKQPGFNPHKVYPGEEVIVQEQEDNTRICHRLNPNLPPKHLACKHQLDQKTAECPVTCPERAIPDGFNVSVYWDKTQGTRGGSFLHIPKVLKDLMDLYLKIQSGFFEGKTDFQSGEDILHSEAGRLFFLNSKGSCFSFVVFDNISAYMQIDVSSYTFRRIITTWALCHKSEEIQEAEEEALNHSNKVAKEAYMQNKMLKPQLLTQTYIREENLFPEKLKKNY